MTVKIGEMTANFSNAQIVYTAIGMLVTDNGSDENSKLLNLSVNADAKFAVYKDGSTKISTNYPLSSNNTILSINNANNNIITITPRNVQLNVDTKSNTHFFVKSYSEAAVNTGSSTLFDLNQGSVFICRPTQFGNAAFIKPNTSFNDPLQTYTCTVIVDRSATAPNGAWTTSSVIWPGGRYPAPAGNTAVYNFMNIGSTNFWYGFFAGENFRRP